MDFVWMSFFGCFRELNVRTFRICFFLIVFTIKKIIFLRKKLGNLGISSETTIPGISRDDGNLGISSEPTETRRHGRLGRQGGSGATGGWAA